MLNRNTPLVYIFLKSNAYLNRISEIICIMQFSKNVSFLQLIIFMVEKEISFLSQGESKKVFKLRHSSL